MAVKLETLPLYSTTAKTLKFFAYLIDDHWRCYVFLISTVVLNVLEINYLLSSRHDFINFVFNLFLMVLWLATNMRAYAMIRNRKQINGFLEEIHFTYMDISERGDAVSRDMLDETTRSARRFSYMNFLLGFFSCIGMFSSAILANQRELIFGITFPFLDEKKLETPYYEVIFLFQFFLIPIGCCMFMTYINLMITLTMFSIFLCQILQKELKDTKSELISSVVNQKLIGCIRMHDTISRYVNKTNDFTTYVSSLEFVSFGALMCVLLFLLAIIKTVYEQMIALAYITMIFIQLSVTYFYANRLYFESLGVADAAYETNWHQYNAKTRMILSFIIQRAQKPICLTMGNFHPMTLEVLKTLLNFTYSYFTILRNMMN